MLLTRCAITNGLFFNHDSRRRSVEEFMLVIIVAISSTVVTRDATEVYLQAGRFT